MIVCCCFGVSITAWSTCRSNSLTSTELLTCDDMVVSAVQVLVNLWQATFYVPKRYHAKTGCGAGLAMILCTYRTSVNQTGITAIAPVTP